MKKIDCLTIGIFGPSDCATEKDHLRRLITENSSLRVIAKRFGLILQACSGDDVTSGPGRPQDRINRYIAEEDPDLSIFVFKDSFGSDAGLGLTGTEEEWQIAIDALAARPEFDLGLYFAAGTPSDPQLTDFRDGIKRGYIAYYTVFENLADFGARLQHKLSEFLLLHAKKNDEPLTVISDAVESLATSPFSVATYPRSLPGGEVLPRPELTTLMDRVTNNESSATVILGDRGSGKSALLAAFESELKPTGFAVLSIKADMLGSDVRDELALDRALRLPLGFSASIQLVATQRPVVVLVDQLDALADILDRRTERLNVLLDAIRSVSNIPNVHLVLSSRPFEFHHDVRLRSLSAERLDLELPPWSNVAPILEKNGHPSESISDSVRDLLRNPWTLNEFLRLRPKEVNFESLFALLEEVWAATVDAPGAPSGTRELVDGMVVAMSSDEMLWVPRSTMAVHEESRRYLLDQDVIHLDENNLRVAFRHQSFFEFALVRRFAAGHESLAAHILGGSQNLFVRPVALAGLAYLRGTVPRRYEAELRELWDAQPRPHLQALIVDFIAAQRTPLSTEISIITQMLGDQRRGPRALAAIGPYAAWFPILRATAAFAAWLRRPPSEAIHAAGLLATQASQSADEVLDVLEREWLGSEQYDRLSFLVLYNLSQWSERAMEVLQHLVKRSAHRGVYDLALQMIGNTPHFAGRLLRTELDRHLNEILENGSERSELRRALEKLLDDDAYTGVFTDLAEKAPEVFMASLLPWIVQVLEATADERERFQQYEHSPVSLTPDGVMPVPSLIDTTIAVLERIAATDPDEAMATLAPYLESEVMGVHVLATFALCAVAPARPSAVAEYLLQDKRRLAIGNWARAHQFSKLLIEATVPYLTEPDVRRLETAIMAYDYYIAPDESLSDDQRSRKAPWNREHKLFLLQSFPDVYLSADGLRLKHALEAEFPGADESMFGQITGGMVEAPFNRADLERQSDDEIVAVFEELTDNTGWDHPRRWSDGDRLVGGAIQQSRVIAELAETDPERVFRLAQRFRPHDQELPTAEAVSGLVKTGLDPRRLLSLIIELAEKGFDSDDFVTAVARALKTLSEKLNGLPDEMIALLSRWLEQLQAPSAEEARDASEAPADHALVFGPRGYFIEPHGRGPVIEAIASGYLDRKPPQISKWVEIVRDRLDVEQHPGVWVMTIRHLQDVLKEDATLGTELFSAIFECHPDVLRESFAFLLIAHWIRRFTPTDAVLRWLDILATFQDPRSQQVMGELLYLYAWRQTDSRDRVWTYLNDGNSRYIVSGFAYAAAYLWRNVSTRTLGLDVFKAEIERWPDDAAKTLSTFLIVNRDELELDEPTQELFRTAAKNDAILLRIFSDLGEEIEPRTVQEPAFVAHIARAFVSAPTEQIEGSLAPIHRGNVPEVITSIALTLHRMPAFASVGLDLFEKLLDANLREAQAATELLDRKPSRRFTPNTRRPRRPRRIRRRR